jgi:hypothetical protein
MNHDCCAGKGMSWINVFYNQFIHLKRLMDRDAERRMTYINAQQKSST